MPASAAPPKWVVISYESGSVTLARAMKAELEARGFKVWSSVQNIEEIHEWSTDYAIHEAISAASVVCPLMTAGYQNSLVCAKQLSYAEHVKVPIVPIIASEFRPSLWLNRICSHATCSPVDFFSNGLDHLDTSVESLVDVFERYHQIQPVRSPKPNLFVGENVHVKSAVDGKWYAAVITAAHTDMEFNNYGCYDIEYDDGDVECDVERDMIRDQGWEPKTELVSNTMSGLRSACKRFSKLLKGTEGAAGSLKIAKKLGYITKKVSR